MKTPSMIGLKSLAAIFMAVGLASTQAQVTSTTWIGPASGGEWNTPANWDAGAPPNATTNATIGGGTNVNYNFPMSAATFGSLTNFGTLNVNTNGFNTTGIFMLRPGGGDKLFLNTGGVINVTGNVGFSSNAIVTMSGGSSFSVSGSLFVGSGNSGGSGGGTVTSVGFMTNNGGFLSASATGINPANGSLSGGGPSALLVINGGTNNLGTTSIKRSSAGSGGFNALGTEGLVIYGGQVTTINMNIGGGSGNSFLSTYIAGGVVTNTGSVFINQGSSARGSRLHQTGGLFVVPDPGVVNPNPTVAGSLNNYVVLGGTNIVGGFYLGNTNLSGGTVNVTNGGTIYVGSQGMASNGAVIVNVALNNGGLFGATVPWTGSVPMKLTGGTFSFQTADMNNSANNITLTAPLNGTGSLLATGGGTLTLGGANTYSGNTFINGGTFALSAGATMTSPRIFVSSGTILDVSQVSGFTLNAGQTLSGSGAVNGAVTAAATSVIFPGSNSVTGTLTFNSGLTENGSVNNEFNLSSNPNGPGNDFMSVSGGLNLSGVNTVIISGALQNGAVYPLINYNGNLTGDISNLAVSGATGVFSNSVSTSIIYFVPQTSVRGPTNITWIGNPLNNTWDVEDITNWLNNGTAALDFFVPNDTVLFSNLGASNSQVNIPGTVLPSVVIVNTTSNYTLLGNGAIGGTAGVTVSNGTMNVLTTNTYTGPTTLAGGVLLTPLIANSGSPSGIGGGPTDPGTLVFNGGTLAYDGVSAATDHGITLTNTGGTIDVTNGTTLTLNGTIVGNGGLTLVDSGTLTLTGNNSYSGNTTITSGTLNLDNVNGAGSGTIVLSGGTLGMILSPQQMYPNNVTVVSNSTINSAGGNNNVVNGVWIGNSNVTLNVKMAVAGSTFTVGGSMTNFYGTIELGADTGFFRFNTQNSNTQFGAPNTVFDLGTSNAALEAKNPGTIAVGTLIGGTNTSLTGPSGNDGALTWQLGCNTNVPNATFYGTILNVNGARTCGIDKIGIGTTSLAGQNTYTGNTTIDSGVLALTNNPFTGTDGAILNSANIIINAGGILDVTGRSDGTLSLNTGQVLGGVGTLHGTLSTGSGIVSPGGGIKGTPGTLTVNGTANLGGTAWMKVSPGASPNSDRLMVTGGNAINYGGTLVLTNVGAAFHVGETFTLFAGSSLNGNFNLVLPNYYTWDTSQLNINGSIKLTAVLPPPSFTGIDLSDFSNDGIIYFSAINGAPNSVVNILTSTNLAAPLSTWTVLTQSAFTGTGTRTVAAPRQGR